MHKSICQITILNAKLSSRSVNAVAHFIFFSVGKGSVQTSQACAAL